MTYKSETTTDQAHSIIKWAEIDIEYFLRDLSLKGPVKLQINYRAHASNMYLWTITWKSYDGQDHHMTAHKLEDCLWRAAVREQQLRKKG